MSDLAKPPAKIRGQQERDGVSKAGNRRHAGRRKFAAFDAEARRGMIAEAAYYRAQARGFGPGGEMHDWLEAEREIDRMTQSVSQPAKRNTSRSKADAATA